MIDGGVFCEFVRNFQERAPEENSKNREINVGGGKKSIKFQFCEPVHSF